MKYYSILLSFIVFIIILNFLTPIQLSAQSYNIRMGISYGALVKALDVKVRYSMKKNFSKKMETGRDQFPRTKDILYYHERIVHLEEEYGGTYPDKKIMISEATVYLFKRGRLVLWESMRPFSKYLWDIWMSNATIMNRVTDKSGGVVMYIKSPLWKNGIGLYTGPCDPEWFTGTCMSIISQDRKNWR